MAGSALVDEKKTRHIRKLEPRFRFEGNGRLQAGPVSLFMHLLGKTCHFPYLYG
jgi:hypothetical protein